jgi:ferritin-like metal-binding protein YciE
VTDERHSLQTYVSDMLAVERHIRVPFETQHKDDDFSKYGDAGSIVAKLSDVSQQHIDALDRCLKDLGGHEASPIKSAVTQLEGAAAGVIDKMRKTKVSKALRDDYTALALCTASYTLLQSTALGLGDRSVADLAQRHLEDYARCIMSVQQALPDVALRELRDDGLDIDATAAEEARRAADQAWSNAGRSSAARSEIGTIGQGIPANEGGISAV